MPESPPRRRRRPSLPEQHHGQFPHGRRWIPFSTANWVFVCWHASKRNLSLELCWVDVHAQGRFREEASDFRNGILRNKDHVPGTQMRILFETAFASASSSD